MTTNYNYDKASAQLRLALHHSSIVAGDIIGDAGTADWRHYAMEAAQAFARLADLYRDAARNCSGVPTCFPSPSEIMSEGKEE
jgi:hypothetical protein